MQTGSVQELARKELTAPAAVGSEAVSVAIPSANSRRRMTDYLTALCLLGDVVAIGFSLALSYWVRFFSGWITFGVEGPSPHYYSDYLFFFQLGTIFLVATFLKLRLYDPDKLLHFRAVALILLEGCTFWFCAFLAFSLVLKFQPPISRLFMLCAYLTCSFNLLAWRSIFHRVLLHERIARRLRERILIVGQSPEGNRLVQSVADDPRTPFSIVGRLSVSGREANTPHDGVVLLGELAEVTEVIRRHPVDVLVLADPDLRTEQVIDLANFCEKNDLQFKKIPNYFQVLLSGLELQVVSGVPLLGSGSLPLNSPDNRAIKRCVDIIGSIVGLIISTPLFAIFGALVYLESPGPIFYRQVRVGQNGKKFKIIKIRSMHLDAEANGGAQWARKNDSRRLRIGAFLRKWNIDETPQFWNVLRGDMSLVGPRPERPELIKNFKEEIPHYNARHASKPGVTGWAQINGLRGDCDLNARVRYDLYYLENWNLWLDLQIMLLTFINRENGE